MKIPQNIVVVIVENTTKFRSPIPSLRGLPESELKQSEVYQKAKLEAAIELIKERVNCLV